MIEQDIEILKQMRAELQQRITALDSAIQIMEQVRFGPNSSETEIEPEAPKSRKRKTKNTSFESSIDLSTIPDYNPNGGGIRTD